MKIDLNNASGSLIPADWAAKGAASRSADASNEASGDRTTISTQGSAVQDLAAKALDTPEIRQEKVNALRESVNNGTYSLDPSKIAEAMIDSESQ